MVIGGFQTVGAGHGGMPSTTNVTAGEREHRGEFFLDIYILSTVNQAPFGRRPLASYNKNMIAFWWLYSK